jgi:hypothetical protein
MILIYAKHIQHRNTCLNLQCFLQSQGIHCYLTTHMPSDIEQTTNNLYIIVDSHEMVYPIPKNYIIYEQNNVNVFYDNNTGNIKKYNMNGIWFDVKYQELLGGAQQIWFSNRYNMSDICQTFQIASNKCHHLPVQSLLSKSTKNTSNTNNKNKNTNANANTQNAKKCNILFIGEENLRVATILDQLRGTVHTINSVVPWDAKLGQYISESDTIIDIGFYNNMLSNNQLLESFNTSSYNGIIISESSRSDDENVAMQNNTIKTFKYKNMVNSTILLLRNHQQVRNKQEHKEEQEQEQDQEQEQEQDQEQEQEPESKMNEFEYLEQVHKSDYNRKRRRRSKSANRAISTEWYIPTNIQEAETEVNDEGGLTLKLNAMTDDELPSVSIVTPTYNRSKLFSLPIINYQNFLYPHSKLEWVIVDDGDDELRDILPIGQKDMNINYIKVDEKMSIGAKRNLGVEQAKHDIIVFMDDDDYYPPESVISRVKCLLKYSYGMDGTGIGCVGCINVLSYDLASERFVEITNGQQFFSEASMCFTRKFWNQRQFQNNDETGEYYYFLEYRQDQMISLPSQFVIVSINHGGNTIKRRFDGHTSSDDKESKKLYDQIFDFEMKAFLMQLRTIC